MTILNPNNWTPLEAYIVSLEQLLNWIDFVENIGRTLKINLGIELKNEMGESLSIGIVAEEAFLLHTADIDLQHCTIGNNLRSGTVDVYWDQLTEIPKKWLIKKQNAVDGIHYWLQNGGIHSELQWSDQTW